MTNKQNLIRFNLVDVRNSNGSKVNVDYISEKTIKKGKGVS